MPYVTVIFDPRKVAQEYVSELKKVLQFEVAQALSSDKARIDTTSTVDITTRPGDIVVRQWATHPTDVNVLPLEIYIEAGQPKGRSCEKIVELLRQVIAKFAVTPSVCIGEDQAGIFIVFHEHNSFGFIPKH